MSGNRILAHVPDQPSHAVATHWSESVLYAHRNTHINIHTHTLQMKASSQSWVDVGTDMAPRVCVSRHKRLGTAAFLIPFAVSGTKGGEGLTCCTPIVYGNPLDECTYVDKTFQNFNRRKHCLHTVAFRRYNCHFAVCSGCGVLGCADALSMI